MKTIYEKDKDVLIGATIVDVSPDENDFGQEKRYD